MDWDTITVHTFGGPLYIGPGTQCKIYVDFIVTMVFIPGPWNRTSSPKGKSRLEDILVSYDVRRTLLPYLSAYEAATLDLSLGVTLDVGCLRQQHPAYI